MKIINPSFNYDEYGLDYSARRRPDPEIEKLIFRALGDSSTIINIGAGAGSYEPDDRFVVAVEPSLIMRKQRIAGRKIPAVKANADALPFDDKAFDAATAFLTVHHWPDITKGIWEMRRVGREKIVILTYDPSDLDVFWNAEYFPEVVEIERQRYPSIQWLCSLLGDNCEVWKVPVPLNCVDGFQEAFYGRPEAFLSKSVRAAMSAWAGIPDAQQELMVERLSKALASGRWDEKYHHLRTQPFFTGALRLIIAPPPGKHI